MTINKDPPIACPCCSGMPYENCCKHFHDGDLPNNALELMRSRYTAYVFNIPEYIMQTTHPASPQYYADRSLWARKIASFSQHSSFDKLEILDHKEQGTLATVTFVAHVFQKEQDATFTEKSYFERVKGKWLYRNGQLAEGHAPNLITTGQIRLLPLAYYGDPILRKVADFIPEITDDIRILVEEMEETMNACNGIGLAAPQVHHSIRLFIIRKPIETGTDEFECGEVKVFINPEIEILSSNEEKWTTSEGCLSIPTIHADVVRPKEITVSYTNLEGKQIKEHVSGWEARVILHENDHINGILFIDRLETSLREKLDPLLENLKGRIHAGAEL